MFASLLLTLRNVSDKSCRENQNTHFMFSNIFFFRKSCSLWDNFAKHGAAGRAIGDNTIRRMRTACWVPKATDTHSEHVILLFHDNYTYANTLKYYFIVNCPSFFFNVVIRAVSIRVSWQEMYLQDFWQPEIIRNDLLFEHVLVAGRVIVHYQP